MPSIPKNKADESIDYYKQVYEKHYRPMMSNVAKKRYDGEFWAPNKNKLREIFGVILKYSKRRHEYTSKRKNIPLNVRVLKDPLDELIPSLSTKIEYFFTAPSHKVQLIRNSVGVIQCIVDWDFINEYNIERKVRWDNIKKIKVNGHVV